jgi:AAA+ superfamily predicted ATPase
MDTGIALEATCDQPETWTKDWLEWLDAAIRREILRLKARYELSLDEFRGLYISDEQVSRLLECETSSSDVQGSIGKFADCPIAAIARRMDLDEGEQACIFAAMAPELDLKYSVLYAYLNNDAGAKHLTVDLLLRLTGMETREIQPNCPIFEKGLMLAHADRVSQAWRSMAVSLSAPLREHLLNPSDNITRIGSASVGPARILLEASPGVIVIEVSPGGDSSSLAHELASRVGLQLIAVTRPTVKDLRDLVLKARLAGAALYFSENCFNLLSPDLPDSESQVALREALAMNVPAIFAIAASAPWRPFFECRNHESIRVEAPTPSARLAYWEEQLSNLGLQADAEDLAHISRLYSLHPGQIRRAAAHAARRTNRPEVDQACLAEAARLQGTTALQGLGIKETTTLTWDNLVLSKPAEQRLREVENAIRMREKVFGEWSFKNTSMGRASLKILFSGASGTGKTLSATVIANEVGLDMYRVDLSAIVSKYIGETEKNLERVFCAAEGSNAILFFDEADALFGKRAEVKDAHDRFANIEISYLLQRMDQYEGVMILATNFSKNIDEAFSRRIHFNIDFSMPDVPERLRLWELSIPDKAPRQTDLDLSFLAKQFALAGGDIRNVALDAAFLAAGEGTAIGMIHLARAMARQRLKQGKLPSPSEFKQYYVHSAPDPSSNGHLENRSDEASQ